MAKFTASSPVTPASWRRRPAGDKFYSTKLQALRSIADERYISQ
ncbi:MAG: hypothetical protein WC545_01060 [Patescibacteria group bacterium]